MPWYAWIAAGYFAVSLLVVLAVAMGVVIADVRDAWRAGERRQAITSALPWLWMVGLVVAWAVLAGWLPRG